MSEFADLDPTPEELADLDEVLDEVEALEELGLLDDDPDGEGYGPWQDQAAQLADLGATLDAQQGSEAQRQLEDSLPPARTSEERFSQALDRISRGSYVPGVPYRPVSPSHGCGDIYDEVTGACASRYHTNPACMQASSHDAAVGGDQSTEAWNRALLRNQAIKADLDEATALLDYPEPGPPTRPCASNWG